MASDEGHALRGFRKIFADWDRLLARHGRRAARNFYLGQHPQADHASSDSYSPGLTREQRIAKGVRAKFDLPEGWIFRECPRTSRPVWRRMLEVFGEENYYVLSMDYLRDFHIRGQLMIAPEAVARLRARLAELPPLTRQTHDSSREEVTQLA